MRAKNITSPRQKGFSLLEILVAFSILAMSLGVLLKIFSGGLQSAILSEEYSYAVTIAESILARTGVEEPLEEGFSKGEQEQKYAWSVQIVPFIIEDLPEQDNPIHQLYQITVVVAWGEEQRNKRSVELNTLRLANIQ